MDLGKGIDDGDYEVERLPSFFGVPINIFSLDKSLHKSMIQTHLLHSASLIINDFLVSYYRVLQVRWTQLHKYNMCIVYAETHKMTT